MIKQVKVRRPPNLQLIFRPKYISYFITVNVCGTRIIVENVVQSDISVYYWM